MAMFTLGAPRQMQKRDSSIGNRQAPYSAALNVIGLKDGNLKTRDISKFPNAGIITAANYDRFYGGLWLMTLNGTTKYVSFPSVQQLQPLSAMTISLWIKRLGSIGTRTIFVGKGSLGTTANTSYWLELTTANILRVVISTNGTTYYQVNATDLTITDITKWHHIVCTWGNNKLKLYLDNQQSTITDTTSGTLTQTNTNMAYGRGGTVTGFLFNGIIDDIQLYGEEKKAGEVAKMYAENKFIHS